MALDIIKKLLANDREAVLKGSLVVDEATGKSFEDHVADKSMHLTAEDVEKQISALKKTLEDFLTGEADGGDIDRLVELVAAISSNRDTIDALVSGKIAKEDIVNDLVSVDETKVLSAAQGKVLKGLIDALEEKVEAASEGSVGFVSEDSEEPVFDGKLVMVVSPYAQPDGETAGS